MFDADILAVQRLEGLQLRSQGQAARTDDVSHGLDIGFVGFGKGQGNSMIHMQGIISIHVLSENNFHHFFKTGFA